MYLSLCNKMYTQNVLGPMLEGSVCLYLKKQSPVDQTDP